ncbi:MAG: hypothetical protein ACRDF5_08345 [bacterium]
MAEKAKATQQRARAAKARSGTATGRSTPKRKAAAAKAKKPGRGRGPVGRFQVFALLQAARAHRLGLPMATARSWGLNRAIFVAAARWGFEAKKSSGPPAWKGVADDNQPALTRTYGEFFLGEDKAYKVEVDGVTLFTIGGEIQTPDAFTRQVTNRFGKTAAAAWEEAQQIIGGYPRAVLESPEEFFSRVYRPRRDELAAKWSKAVESAPGGPDGASR